ncbi:MAG TPA: ferredoxin [Bacteroidota bacterium]|nr:ferredoxin [Bacteroidota bacterium]
MMTESIHKPLAENVPGRFFVMDSCNGCGLCMSYAIHSFTFDDSACFYYIYRQPETNEEADDVLRAISVCPMDAIKDREN